MPGKEISTDVEKPIRPPRGPSGVSSDFMELRYGRFPERLQCETKALRGGPEQRCPNEALYRFIPDHPAMRAPLVVCEQCVPNAVRILTDRGPVVIDRIRR